MSTRSDETAGAVSSATEGKKGDGTDDLAKAKVRQLVRAKLFGSSSDVARIGRHTVLERLGSGGMGVVFSAYDPELDRKVAIKLLQSSGTGGEARERLQREAQAMAKLSHPNVVHVYDVGVHEDEVFVAMEHITGQTLDAWLEHTPAPSWREVVALHAQAGRGLSAAHQAGIIHRDFKPANVMVAEDGTVRVLDFGLARSGVEPIDRSQTDLELSDSEDSNDRLTQTGAVLGTPAYMAPEQWLGSATDARTDQFSFCVSLYRALYGHPPFEPTSVNQLGLAVSQGKTQVPAPKRPVPGWLWPVLARGLSVDPEQRFASMDELLAELRKDPAATRRRLALLVAAVGLMGGLIWATYAVSSQRCAGSEAAITDVWSSTRSQALRTAFHNTNRPYAADVAELASNELDAYAQKWVDVHRDACEATQVRGEQSQLLMDLRVGCLTRRRKELRALVDLFEQADAEVVEHATKAISNLTPVTVCSDAERLQAAVPLPDDPNVRAQVESARALLAEIRALDSAGKYSQALERALQLAEQSRPLDYAPLHAEVLYRLALLHGRAADHPTAEATLLEATGAAAAGKHDRAAAQIWTQLIVEVGFRQDRHSDGALLAPAAEAAVARAGNTPDLWAHLHDALGTLHNGAGRYDEALEHYREARRLFSETRGPEDLKVAIVLGNIAFVLEKQGKYESAGEHSRQALAIRVGAYGDSHPAVARTLTTLGTVTSGQGNLDESLAYHQRALRLRERSLLPDHPELADSLNNVGTVLNAQGQYAEALSYEIAALATIERAVGVHNRRSAAFLQNIGNTLHRMGRYDASMEYHRRSLAARERLLGPEHPSAGESLVNLANSVEKLGDQRSALAYLLRGLAIFERAYGPDHPHAMVTLNNLANVRQALGDYAGAEQLHRRALALREKKFGPSHYETASSLLNVGAGFHSPYNNPSPERFELALVYFRRSAIAFERGLGPDHPEVAMALIGMAKALVDLGRAAEARDPIERVIEIRETANVRQAQIADAWYTLARVKWATKDDRPGAVELALKARRTFVEIDRTARLPEIDKWLRMTSGRRR